MEETTWIIIFGSIGAVIIIAVLVANYRNRDSVDKLRPDVKDPHKWLDDEGNEFYY